MRPPGLGALRDQGLDGFIGEPPLMADKERVVRHDGPSLPGKWFPGGRRENATGAENTHTSALNTPGVRVTNQELGKEEFHEVANVTGCPSPRG